MPRVRYFHKSLADRSKTTPAILHCHTWKSRLHIKEIIGTYILLWRKIPHPEEQAIPWWLLRQQINRDDCMWFTLMVVSDSPHEHLFDRYRYIRQWNKMRTVAQLNSWSSTFPNITVPDLTPPSLPVFGYCTLPSMPLPLFVCYLIYLSDFEQINQALIRIECHAANSIVPSTQQWERERNFISIVREGRRANRVLRLTFPRCSFTVGNTSRTVRSTWWEEINRIKREWWIYRRMIDSILQNSESKKGWCMIPPTKIDVPAHHQRVGMHVDPDRAVPTFPQQVCAKWEWGMNKVSQIYFQIFSTLVWEHITYYLPMLIPLHLNLGQILNEILHLRLHFTICR